MVLIATRGTGHVDNHPHCSGRRRVIRTCLDLDVSQRFVAYADAIRWPVLLKATDIHTIDQCGVVFVLRSTQKVCLAALSIRRGTYDARCQLQ